MYSEQLREAATLVSAEFRRTGDPLVYQSRSGPASQPWLGPDILEHLRAVAMNKEVRDVVIVPIGFVSDHMEVVYDLDIEAHKLCGELGLNMVRASCVGTHPKFISMIRDLILERLEPGRERLCVGSMGASHDVCPEGCCPLSMMARPVPA